MLLTTALLFTAALPCAPRQWTRRISESSAGIQANDSTFQASISDDRHCVVMKTYATNLGAGDILVHDLTTGQTRGIANNRLDIRSVPSGNSRYVLHSWSNNHGVEVTDSVTGRTDTILRDTAQLVQPSDLSSDGRYVLFHTGRGNLVGGDNNNAWDVFVFDRALRQYSIISRNSQGDLGNADSMWARMSPDGRFVAFTSYATNLAPGDGNGEPDVFFHDRATETTILVSKDMQGAAAGGWMQGMNADGGMVLFRSLASTLVPGDLNNADDIFAFDTVTGNMERVSTSHSGAEGNGKSEVAAVSASGRFVAFGSEASNLIVGDMNQTRDVFVKDRMTGVVERVSVDDNGQELRASSSLCDISTDGTMVAFSTIARIAPGETNDYNDIFIRHRGRQLADFKDTVTLVASLALTAGTPASGSLYGASNGSHWWLLASNNGAGSTHQGHSLDIGPGVVIVGHGYSSPRGCADYLTPPVPFFLSGRRIFLEIVTRDEGGALKDSNLISRLVQ